MLQLCDTSRKLAYALRIVGVLCIFMISSKHFLPLIALDSIDMEIFVNLDSDGDEDISSFQKSS